MVTAQRLGYRRGLVDPATGRISREIFVNDEIYWEEPERVFADRGCLSCMKARSRTSAISSFRRWASSR